MLFRFDTTVVNGLSRLGSYSCSVQVLFGSSTVQVLINSANCGQRVDVSFGDIGVPFLPLINSSWNFQRRLSNSVLQASSCLEQPAGYFNFEMDQNAAMEEGKVLKNGLELVKSVADKHLDLLRPSSCLFSMFKGYTSENNDREKGKYAHINENGFQQGLYDKPLPCFGCGIGWFLS